MSFIPGQGRVEDEESAKLSGDEFASAFGTAVVPDEELADVSMEALGDDAWARVPQPVGWRILVRPHMGQRVSKGGIHLADSGTTKEALATVVAKVLKMGSICYKNPRKFDLNPETGKIDPWCEEGEWVVIGKYSGARFRLYFNTGENPEVRIINDDEVIAKILDPDDVRTL